MSLSILYVMRLSLGIWVAASVVGRGVKKPTQVVETGVGMWCRKGCEEAYSVCESRIM